MAHLAEVKAHAIRLFARGQHLHALRLCDAIVTAAPLDFEARMKVADCLVALEHPAYAVPVYRAVAEYALASGHPLAAIVAARVLESMSADFSQLIDNLVTRYAAGSEHISSFAARVNLPPPDTSIAPPELRVPAADDFWLDAAKRAAACTEGFTDYPAALHPIPLLSLLSPDVLRRVLATLVVGRVPDGQLVIRQGEPGQSFFFVASGTVRVFTTDGMGRENQIAELHENAIFGEMALLSAAPRIASVQVVGEADLLEATRDSLAALADELAPVARALHVFTHERSVDYLLATCPLFAPFNRSQQRELLRRFTSHEVDTGTPLIHEGEEGRGLFVLLAGEVEVKKRGPSGDRALLTILRAGDVFGAISVVRGQATSASVTAAKPSTVLFLDREYVSRLIPRVPEIKDYLESLARDREIEIKLAARPAPEDQSDDPSVLI